MSGAERSAGTSRLGWAALASLTAGYLLLDLVAGAPDSPLVPPLPAGVGPPGWTVRGAGWLGLSRLTRTQLTLVAIGLLGWVVGAFVLLFAEAWRDRIRLVTVLTGTAIGIALTVAAPPMLSRDLYSYAVYGRILAVHGSNPYEQPPSAFPDDPFVAVASPEWIDTPSVYGPGFTLLSSGMAGAWSESPGATILAFKVVAGVAVVGAAVLAAVAGRALGPGRAIAAAAAVGLNPVLVLHTVGGGHNDALIALLVAAAIALAIGSIRDRPAAWVGEPVGRFDAPAVGVTALLTLAVLVKAIMAPLLVLWLWQIARQVSVRRWSIVGIHAAVVGAITVALYGPVVAGWSTLRALLSVVSRQGWASGPGLVARGARGVGRTLGGTATGAAFDAAVSVAFAGLFLALFWRVLVRGNPHEGWIPGSGLGWPVGSIPDPWGGSVLLLALAAPYLLPWYAAWFAPFLGLMRDRVLVAAGLVASLLLAMTGVPAEAGGAPQVWQDMLLAVHYVVAPVMLVLLGVVVWRMLGLTVPETPAPGASPPAPVRV